MAKYKSQTEYWVDPVSGKFKYEFESMFRDVDDPWGCAAEVKSLNNRLLIEVVRGYNPKSIVDVGCGLGTMLDAVRQRLNHDEKVKLLGIDVSRTAVKKASSKYSDIDFLSLDVSVDDFAILPKFDVVLASEIIWYIAENLEEAIFNISNLLSKTSVLVIKQYFPQNQIYGRDFIDGRKDFYGLMHKFRFFIDKKVESHCDKGVVIICSFCKS